MSQPTQRAWWKEPMVWLIAGLPATAVVASFATYFIAAHKPDPLVKEGYQKQGMTVVNTDAKLDEAASALGLQAEISVERGRFMVALQGRLESPPASLKLFVAHPTDAARDRVVQLFRSAQGDYAGELADAPLGRHRIVLEPDDRVWRLAGEFSLTEAGTWRLAASAPISTTPPRGAH
ncbi:MAG: hypothetical protein FD187_134 [bacterium]|nr:MAG: hypothetical protein FD142_1351 [bacterium]KAF0150702.1 MAG: hypothetical protein FD187_134 [bacterium]KAF0169555.1 MAG: hypothetical protein FD158_388 [bacterium]TXT22483.1 MAG: hypothetical protein FD132_438 [bacterium]